MSDGSYGRLSCRSTVHLFAPLKIFANRVRKYKRCSFSCGMEILAYVQGIRCSPPYSLDECCIFQYRTQMNTVCISYCEARRLSCITIFSSTLLHTKIYHMGILITEDLILSGQRYIVQEQIPVRDKMK